MSVPLAEKTRLRGRSRFGAAKARRETDAPLAERTVLIDDARARITQWRLPPGTQTGWHRHTYDYVTIQQSGGRLRLDYADGTVAHIDYQEGKVGTFTAPLEHNATNVSGIEMRVLEIEFKR
ncbi:MAG TPA: hypothetical protein VGB90_02785 [Alphaproteobacteria bacterium]